jgi:hypothetical protein
MPLPSSRSISRDRLARRPLLDVASRIELPRAADDERFGEIDRVFFDRHDRQQVVVAGDVNGRRRLIAFRNAVGPAQHRGLHVGGVRGERIAFPGSRRET